MFYVENAASEADHIKDKRIILAGPQTTFRVGVAQILSQEKGLQVVAQCDEAAEAVDAIETFKPSTLIITLSVLCANQDILRPLKKSKVGIIVIAATPEEIPAAIVNSVHGRISRDISPDDLVHCVRHVSRGHRHCTSLVQRSTDPTESDLIGTCVRNRLTRRELQVLGLIARAYKNKQIAECLGTKEQVVKNYTRNLFVKCGVTDRLALAVFANTHPSLTEAGEKASTLLIESRSARRLFEFPKNSPETREAYSSAEAACA